eukprot:scaffold11608_cov62-Phaeocystis_antarctica.AAC.6
MSARLTAHEPVCLAWYAFNELLPPAAPGSFVRTPSCAGEAAKISPSPLARWIWSLDIWSLPYRASCAAACARLATRSSGCCMMMSWDCEMLWASSPASAAWRWNASADDSNGSEIMSRGILRLPSS